MASLDD
jgi:hypothetical protein